MVNKISVEKVREAVEYLEGYFSPTDLHFSFIKELLEMGKLFIAKKIGYVLSQEEIWDMLIEVHGCKKSKVDCYYRRCCNWANCDNLVDKLTGLVGKIAEREEIPNAYVGLKYNCCLLCNNYKNDKICIDCFDKDKFQGE